MALVVPQVRGLNRVEPHNAICAILLIFNISFLRRLAAE